MMCALVCCSLRMVQKSCGPCPVAPDAIQRCADERMGCCARPDSLSMHDFGALQECQPTCLPLHAAQGLAPASQFCRSFDARGTCIYGDRCRFLHAPVPDAAAALGGTGSAPTPKGAGLQVRAPGVALSTATEHLMVQQHGRPSSGLLHACRMVHAWPHWLIAYNAHCCHPLPSDPQHELAVWLARHFNGFCHTPCRSCALAPRVPQRRWTMPTPPTLRPHRAPPAACPCSPPSAPLPLQLRGRMPQPPAMAWAPI